MFLFASLCYILVLLLLYCKINGSKLLIKHFQKAHTVSIFNNFCLNFIIQIVYAVFFFPANSSSCSSFGNEKMIPSTSFLILIHYVSDILGESRSFSNSRWDELSRGKTFVAPRLLPVTSLLFTPKGKRSLNWRTSCCS